MVWQPRSQSSQPLKYGRTTCRGAPLCICSICIARDPRLQGDRNWSAGATSVRMCPRLQLQMSVSEAMKSVACRSRAVEIIQAVFGILVDVARGVSIATQPLVSGFLAACLFRDDLPVMMTTCSGLFKREEVGALPDFPALRRFGFLPWS